MPSCRYKRFIPFAALAVFSTTLLPSPALAQAPPRALTVTPVPVVAAPLPAPAAFLLAPCVPLPSQTMAEAPIGDPRTGISLKLPWPVPVPQGWCVRELSAVELEEARACMGAEQTQEQAE
jgi:hypothetical protein